ncbi:hypothetical protein ACFP3V_18990, partial [Streptacidiphilus monticola]
MEPKKRARRTPRKKATPEPQVGLEAPSVADTPAVTAAAEQPQTTRGAAAAAEQQVGVEAAGLADTPAGTSAAAQPEAARGGAVSAAQPQVAGASGTAQPQGTSEQAPGTSDTGGGQLSAAEPKKRTRRATRKKAEPVPSPFEEAIAELEAQADAGTVVGLQLESAVANLTERLVADEAAAARDDLLARLGALGVAAQAQQEVAAAASVA